MEAFFRPLSPFWALLGRNPYLSALACAVVAGLAAYVHSGNMVALFACIGSMIIMYKVEADHPTQADPLT